MDICVVCSRPVIWDFLGFQDSSYLELRLHGRALAAEAVQDMSSATRRATLTLYCAGKTSYAGRTWFDGFVPGRLRAYSYLHLPSGTASRLRPGSDWFVSPLPLDRSAVRHWSLARSQVYPGCNDCALCSPGLVAFPLTGWIFLRSRRTCCRCHLWLA
ncbi:hypothetical protein KC327_g17 [Hortaea werneckii]|nr:hypothetical protein KC327_g17 [Hortaea werneckii]